MAVNYNNQSNQPCKWHTGFYRGVYLGPNEGPEHAEVVRSARQRGFQASPPDVFIAVEDQTEKVHRSLLMLESPERRGFYAKNANCHTIKLKDPVHPCHLSKIANYLYAKDYAVLPPDISALLINLKDHLTNCRRCDDIVRLLYFHFSLFQAARYMSMEGLQLLAIKKFNAVLETAPLAVLRLAVHMVYSHKPHVNAGQAGDVYEIAHFVDYREQFVLPAVMPFIRRMWTQLERANPETFLSKDLPGYFDPIQSFEDLIKTFPDFEHHLTLWSSHGQYLPFMELYNLK